jgi:hypothetical protein
MAKLLFFQVLLLFVIPTDYPGMLRSSLTKINDRYSNSVYGKLVQKLESITEDGAIRDRIYSEILTKGSITDPQLIIEYSSSGETFSYNCIVIGFDNKTRLCYFDYNFYSNNEKFKVKTVRNSEELLNQINELQKLDYDSEKKENFPSEFVLISFLDEQGVWAFRISETPTKQIEQIILSLK